MKLGLKGEFKLYADGSRAPLFRDLALLAGAMRKKVQYGEHPYPSRAAKSWAGELSLEADALLAERERRRTEKEEKQ